MIIDAFRCRSGTQLSQRQCTSRLVASCDDSWNEELPDQQAVFHLMSRLRTEEPHGDSHKIPTEFTVFGSEVEIAHFALRFPVPPKRALMSALRKALNLR